MAKRLKTAAGTIAKPIMGSSQSRQKLFTA
jgi:hypothetical protein